jgi:hypothetical protein
MTQPDVPHARRTRIRRDYHSKELLPVVVCYPPPIPQPAIVPTWPSVQRRDGGRQPQHPCEISVRARRFGLEPGSGIFSAPSPPTPSAVVAPVLGQPC